KDSGKGGSQSRLLVLLIRESRAWSIDVPSHNVTHQPDTPATGLSACNPACSGLSNLHISSDAPARVPRHSPRSRVGLVCSSMRNFLAGVILRALAPLEARPVQSCLGALDPGDARRHRATAEDIKSLGGVERADGTGRSSCRRGGGSRRGPAAMSPLR